ncbi:MAG: hypothetical protein WB771_04720 [Solirubrobacterales bacterium]
MISLALIRPDAWALPLFLHIFGAMVLVGALGLSAVSLIGAWRNGSPALTRLGYMSLFYGALPGYIVFRAGAEWIADKEGLTDSNLTWVGIGYGVSDTGFVLLLVSLAIGGVSVRRMNRGGEPSASSARIVTGLVSLVLIAYLVAVWAMTTKPA